MGRDPHPRSRHASDGDDGVSASNGARDDVRRAARSGGQAPPRRPRPTRPSRRPGSGGGPHAKGSHTVIWLLLILAVVIGTGWVLFQTTRDGGDEPAPVAQDPGLATGDPIMRLTIPEGLRREDVAELIERETDLSGERYLELTGPGPRGRALARADGPTSLEGFLFPATYDLFEETTVEDLVDMQVEAFTANTADIDFGPARRKNLTPFEVLTIASMIEREVAVPAERELVSSVIYNRLRTGMSLGIDATVQYAVGEWKPELTLSDLDIDSPYNTRKFTGLPPGPIANPGRDSIRAAARPKETDFIYYVARNDGSGAHYFSTNADQFERDVQRSRANGGQ
jgi:UPF0755 protein